jgi:PAS domain S-box-containing protein
MVNKVVKILAIDDNPDNLVSIRALIQDALPKAITVTASTGAKGLEMAASEDPDVILLDIVMPDMDGFEVCRRLKEDNSLGDIPVIFLTATRGDRESRIRALEAGAEAFLAKPIEETELIAQIRAMVKIKIANIENRDEKKVLEALVDDRTRELREIQKATLNLLEDLRQENEARRKSEERLREAEARYHMLFDHAPDGIVILDPETGDIIEFNETMCRQLDYSPEEFSGLKISDFNTSFTQGEIRDRIAEAMTRERIDFETRHRTRNGEIRTIHVTLMSTEISGRPMLHCVSRDITERRRLQDQLRHAQKLEGIGQLAGGIAHDFNNVLNAVIGYAELIRKHLESDDPAKHFAEEITAAGMRGASLTRQILAFSRKQTLDMKPVNINKVIDNLKHMMRRLLREDILINMNLAKQDLFIMADADQLDQVLINLTTNARDAMIEGGTIDIATDRFAIDAEFIEMHGYGEPGEYAVIRFSDTGSGMDAETRQKIFDPFFTTKETGEGTGLGLAVVHGILKQHGGFVNVYSEPGRGTIFSIYLPLIRHDDSKKPETAEQSEIRKGTETILIAEDDPALRKLSRIMLEQFGYKVIEAADGEEAIRKFSDNSDEIRLALLDGIMPKKNGGEVFAAISRIKPGIKTIFMSGYADGIFSQKDVSGKDVAFLHKPVKPEDLLRLIRKTLDSK